MRKNKILYQSNSKLHVCLSKMSSIQATEAQYKRKNIEQLGRIVVVNQFVLCLKSTFQLVRGTCNKIII